MAAGWHWWRGQVRVGMSMLSTLPGDGSLPCVLEVLPERSPAPNARMSGVWGMEQHMQGATAGCMPAPAPSCPKHERRRTGSFARPLMWAPTLPWLTPLCSSRLCTSCTHGAGASGGGALARGRLRCTPVSKVQLSLSAHSFCGSCMQASFKCAASRPPVHAELLHHSALTHWLP